MKIRISFFLLLLLVINCTNSKYSLEISDNRVYKPNTVFNSFEDLTSERFPDLIQKYQIDTIFHGEKNEFERILLIRNWIKSIIRIEDFGDPYPAREGNVEGILDASLEEYGFHCGHFMTVQNAVMNGYGYVTRTLGAGPGVEDGPEGHHGVNEIWSSHYQKWFLSDAKYDNHFEKNGIPLSALEVRESYLKNKAADIILVSGPDRERIDSVSGFSKEEFAQIYTWIAWQGNGDYYTAWPNHQEMVVMLEDEYYRNNIWWRDGKPHWTYRNPQYLILVQSKDDIEWTPNTIASKVSIEGNSAYIELISDTPNFKEYQIRVLPGENWEPVTDKVTLKLKKEQHSYHFRVLNLADVPGPIHEIKIVSK